MPAKTILANVMFISKVQNALKLFLVTNTVRVKFIGTLELNTHSLLT
jgi:hypothetical protein